MKIDFNYKFTTLDGKIIPEEPDQVQEGEDGKKKTKKFPPFTLRKACVDVLLMTELDGNGRPIQLKGEEKVKRYALAMKLHNSNGLVDVRPEEQVLLKKLIGRAYGPLTVGQAWNILDPHEAAEKEAEAKKETESTEISNKDN